MLGSKTDSLCGRSGEPPTAKYYMGSLAQTLMKERWALRARALLGASLYLLYYDVFDAPTYEKLVWFEGHYNIKTSRKQEILN